MRETYSLDSIEFIQCPLRSLLSLFNLFWLLHGSSAEYFIEKFIDKTKKSHQYRMQLAIYLGEIEKNDGHRLQLNISRICSLCVVIITFLLHFDLWLFHGNDFFSLAGVNVHAFLVARVCVCEHVNKWYAFFFSFLHSETFHWNYSLERNHKTSSIKYFQFVWRAGNERFMWNKRWKNSHLMEFYMILIGKCKREERFFFILRGFSSIFYERILVFYFFQYFSISADFREVTKF